MKRLFFAFALALFGAWRASAAGIIEGRVAETMDSGGYTYVRLVQGEDSTWVAVPQTKLKIGQEVAFSPGVLMYDFRSNTLNRTFERIVFSSGAPQPSAHPGAPVLAKEKALKVAKAQGPDGYTVEEVYKKAASLAGRTVSVRGKVVKVSTAIMNRNWIHLQDGSGQAKAGTHDLLATSAQAPKAGETVTAAGTVAKDRDFGFGYSYKVLLENASFKP